MRHGGLPPGDDPELIDRPRGNRTRRKGWIPAFVGMTKEEEGTTGAAESGLSVPAMRF